MEVDSLNTQRKSSWLPNPAYPAYPWASSLGSFQLQHHVHLITAAKSFSSICCKQRNDEDWRIWLTSLHTNYSEFKIQSTKV